jgi:hypothetical protein
MTPETLSPSDLTGRFALAHRQEQFSLFEVERRQESGFHRFRPWSGRATFRVVPRNYDRCAASKSASRRKAIARRALRKEFSIRSLAARQLRPNVCCKSLLATASEVADPGGAARTALVVASQDRATSVRSILRGLPGSTIGFQELPALWGRLWGTRNPSGINPRKIQWFRLSNRLPPSPPTISRPLNACCCEAAERDATKRGGLTPGGRPRRGEARAPSNPTLSATISQYLSSTYRVPIRADVQAVTRKCYDPSHCHPGGSGLVGSRRARRWARCTSAIRRCRPRPRRGRRRGARVPRMGQPDCEDILGIARSRERRGFRVAVWSRRLLQLCAGRRLSPRR